MDARHEPRRQVAAALSSRRPCPVAGRAGHGRCGERLDEQDHPAAAYLARAASDRFEVAHRLESYQGYSIAQRPGNVDGVLLRAKIDAFGTYSAHDRSVRLPGRRS
jgi:hypothetical protein